jgi:hypothetical protein
MKNLISLNRIAFRSPGNPGISYNSNLAGLATPGSRRFATTTENPEEELNESRKKTSPFHSNKELHKNRNHNVNTVRPSAQFWEKLNSSFSKQGNPQTLSHSQSNSKVKSEGRVSKKKIGTWADSTASALPVVDELGAELKKIKSRLSGTSASNSSPSARRDSQSRNSSIGSAGRDSARRKPMLRMMKDKKREESNSRLPTPFTFETYQPPALATMDFTRNPFSRCVQHLPVTRQLLSEEKEVAIRGYIGGDYTSYLANLDAKLKSSLTQDQLCVLDGAIRTLNANVTYSKDAKMQVLGTILEGVTERKIKRTEVK